MKTKWLQKRFLLNLVLLMLCPKRTLQSEDEESKEDESKPSDDINEPSISGVGLIKQSPEFGFDFTDEEMKKFKLWPNAIIPYFIDEHSFDHILRMKLSSLLESLNGVTGLSFMKIEHPPENENKRWVLFINRRGVLGCEDYTTNNFTNDGVQRVVLGYDCLNADGGSGLASTILALAGVPPQHNAPDRDTHITVMMNNIIPEKRDLFKILQNDEWLFHDIPYDFLSAGHYNFHKYTVNGKATIVPRGKEPLKSSPVGEEDGLSPSDVWKLRMLYNYISINRKTARTDCSKLFRPGKNFQTFKPESNNRIQPRKKPNKYLGTEKSEEITNNKDDTENSGGDSDNKGLETTFGSDVDRTYKLKKMKKSKAKILQDKLGDLSDFDTDVDRMRNNKVRHSLKAVMHSKNKDIKNKMSIMTDYDTDKQ